MRILNFLKTNNDKQKSIRIKTEIGDKFLNVNLDQTYESLDILSLKIFQKDVYRLFDADYGIIVGRVLGEGVGIPNCKISVFIPIDEETTPTPTTLEDIKKIEAVGLYSYTSVYDKDSEGKVYNLLPKYSKNRNFNGFPDNQYGIGATPKTPVGTFPEKEEVLVNETLAYVYDKYLKYTTVTNESGDYILTVPSNRTYIVHMSCDITDIGRFSTTPALLKLDGYPDSFFKNNNLLINDDLPLENLPNIDIQNISINVKPLWSQNADNINVGINRLDFTLTKKIKPFITVVGNYFTPHNKSWWGERIIFRAFIGIKNLCFGPDVSKIPQPPSKFFSLIIGVRFYLEYWLFRPKTFDIFLGFNTSNVSVNNLPKNEFLFGVIIRNVLPFFSLSGVLKNKVCTLNGSKNDYESIGIINLGLTAQCDRKKALSVLEGLSNDLFIQSHVKGNLNIDVYSIKNTLTEQEADLANQGTIIGNYDNDIELLPNDKYITIKNKGNFINLIKCNRYKVVSDENGNLIEVPSDNKTGVFTKFRGYFYVTNDGNIDNPPFRWRTAKIALKIPQFVDYGDPNNSNSTFNKWVWRHFNFDYGKIYSVAQYSSVRNFEMQATNEALEEEQSLLNNQLIGSYNQTIGFDNQTNILFMGAIEDTIIINSNNEMGYGRNGNILNPNYINFYNHLTYLGEDVDNNVNIIADIIESEDGTYEAGNDFIPPPPPPDDYTNFNVIIRVGGTFSNTNSAEQNPPAITYYVISSPNFLNLNFIIGSIQVSIFEIDSTFVQSPNDYSLKITRNSDDVDITNFDNIEGNEWIPIELSNTSDPTIFSSTNDFIIESSNFTETLYYDIITDTGTITSEIPNTPYISELNTDIPCTLSFRKKNSAQIKSLPINIRLTET
jgi:hypothetical protein